MILRMMRLGGTSCSVGRADSERVCDCRGASEQVVAFLVVSGFSCLLPIVAASLIFVLLLSNLKRRLLLLFVKFSIRCCLFCFMGRGDNDRLATVIATYY